MLSTGGSRSVLKVASVGGPWLPAASVPCGFDSVRKCEDMKACEHVKGMLGRRRDMYTARMSAH